MSTLVLWILWKKGNLFAVGCDPCRKGWVAWWMSAVAQWLNGTEHHTTAQCNTPLWPDCQTPLNKCSVKPLDHRDPTSEASSPVASHTRMGLKDGSDLVENVSHERSIWLKFPKFAASCYKYVEWQIFEETSGNLVAKHNRTHEFVRHCMHCLPPTVAVYEEDVIVQTSSDTFTVRSGSSQYTIQLSSPVPSCDCIYWDRHYLRCKHMLAIVQRYGWDQMPMEYINCLQSTKRSLDTLQYQILQLHLIGYSYSCRSLLSSRMWCRHDVSSL